MTVTLVHLSDLHYHRLPWGLETWRLKRLAGAANWWLRRRRRYPLVRARAVVARVGDMAWDHLVITGDVTQLGLAAEMALAQTELAPLLARGPQRVTLLPGNHDRYVHPGRRHDAFTQHFGPFFQAMPGLGFPATQPELGVRHLGGCWYLAAWDATHFTPPFIASGHVPKSTLEATDRWLATLPAGSRVVLACHYPLLFPPPHRFHRRHDLTNLETVADWVASRPVEVYLHGHLHHNWTIRTQTEGKSLLHVNSASSSQVPPPGATSCFHVLTLPEQGLPTAQGVWV